MVKVLDLPFGTIIENINGNIGIIGITDGKKNLIIFEDHGPINNSLTINNFKKYKLVRKKTK